jgi:hypothetical protein
MQHASKSGRWWVSFSFGFACAVCAAPDVAMAQSGASLGDAVLFNGVFLSVDSQNTTWSVIRIQGDTIVGVGNAIGDVGPLLPTTKRIDLGGRTVVPGLIDTHVHFMRGSQVPGYFIRGVETAFSIAALQDAVVETARTAPGGSFLTFVGGINRKQFTENRLPTLAELDAAAPGHPIYLQSGFNGPSATNTLGRTFFQSHGITVSATGRITGSNVSMALTELALAQTTADADRAFRDYVDYSNSVGLTMVVNYGRCAMQGLGASVPSPACADEPYALWQAGELNVRMRLGIGANGPVSGGVYPIVPAMQAALAQLAGFGGPDDMLDVNRTGEFVVGGFGSTTAAFSAAFGQVAAQGWAFSQHSISTAENNAHISAFETVNLTTPIAPLRWTLDHVFSISQADLARLAAVGAGVAVQNQQYLLSNAGPPYQRIISSGVPVAGGTDATGIVPLTPWASIYHMVTGRDAAGTLVNNGQQITRAEALRIYTMGSAWHAFADNEVGSIEVGKLADLVVLSDGYLTVPDAELRSLHAMMTIVGGTIVFTDIDGFETYGCGFNPAGSLSPLSGPPTLGSSWTLGVDNPLGTQPAGSVAGLMLSLIPAADFPCGPQVPGFGMNAPGAIGELLIDLTVGIPLPFVVWNGQGNAASFAIAIPVTPALVGLELFAQGFVADLNPAAPLAIGLTEGVAARIQ